MIGAAFLGMVVFLLSIPGYLRNKTDERSPFWRPSGKRGAARLARRAQAALSRRNFLFGWTLFLPSMLVFLGVTALSLASNGNALGVEVALAYLGGAAVAFGGAYVFGLRRAILADLTAVAKQAAKAIARRGDLADAERILSAAADAKQHRFRLAAAVGLRFVGSEIAEQKLDQLRRDPHEDVRQAAASSLENIRAILQGEGRRSVLPLEEMRVEFQELDDQIELVVDSGMRAQLMVRYHNLHDFFEECIYAQFPLRHSFPDLFCMHCLSRAEEVVFKDWAWVRCKHCKDIFGLQSGVRLVLGEIGGIEDQALSANILRLSLWNVEDKKARGAEIDRLDIFGGQGLDYDWAVSAVVERLRAFASTSEYQVHVSIHNEVTLTSNTQKLLALIQRPSSAESTDA